MGDERRVVWVRVGEKYPDLKGDPDSFVALDGEAGTEVGIAKRLPDGPDEGRWMWSMVLTHPGSAFTKPTNGYAGTRDEAALELEACFASFRAFYMVENV